MPTITAIPGEHLVAAISRQGHRDALARHRADAECRDRRAVAKRLVVNAGQPVEQIERVWDDLLDVMIGPVTLGHPSGISGFVPAFGPECDREGADRLRL